MSVGWSVVQFSRIPQHIRQQTDGIVWQFYDAGVFMFRKLLRDAVRGTNPKASAENFYDWLQSVNGAPDSYCSGNVMEVAEGATIEEEIAQRRMVTRKIVQILTESDNLKGDVRTQFVMEGFEALEQSTKK